MCSLALPANSTYLSAVALWWTSCGYPVSIKPISHFPSSTGQIPYTCPSTFLLVPNICPSSFLQFFIAEHVIIQYKITLWSVWVHCHGCVPSQSLVYQNTCVLSASLQLVTFVFLKRTLVRQGAQIQTAIARRNMS